MSSKDELIPVGVAELDLYQKREKIYTRKIEGFYQRIRVYTGWPLLLGYFLLPWINWDDRQWVLFDLPARKFYVLGFTFWPQDFPLLTGVLIISAFGLFAVTSWLGRVWCGYTCPQTVWTAIFMWAEQLCEGSRNQRMKRDAAPMNMDTFLRKFAKHGMWIGFAGLTGLTFVGYFSPIRQLLPDLVLFQAGIWEWSWVLFFTLATYINAGWMREQVCLYMCPYARFQSVMFDHDTLIVSYDTARGEQRGPRKKTDDPKDKGLGDCVDCQICVQVCPTGIDIRDGLQYECINCALCIDGCDSVMEQMDYPKGLISYTTENALQGKPYRFWRARPVGYSIVVLIMVSIVLTALWVRVPLEVDVIRDRDRMYRELPNNRIENSYTIKIFNMDQSDHNYSISASGLDGMVLEGDREIYLAEGDVGELRLRLSMNKDDIRTPNSKIEFMVYSSSEPAIQASSESRFIAPMPVFKKDSRVDSEVAP